jgi:tetratricopeptide (TPR) repeat protein
LQQQYGSSDLLHILAAEAEKKRYEHVLAVVTALPPRHARSTIASLYRLRALDALGLLSMSALEASGAADGEGYLLRARLLYGRERYDEAMLCLRKAVNAPALLMNRADLEKQAARLKARCLTARIEPDPKPAAPREARNGLYDVNRAPASPGAAQRTGDRPRAR